MIYSELVSMLGSAMKAGDANFQGTWIPHEYPCSWQRYRPNEPLVHVSLAFVTYKEVTEASFALIFIFAWPHMAFWVEWVTVEVLDLVVVFHYFFLQHGFYGTSNLGNSDFFGLALSLN